MSDICSAIDNDIEGYRRLCSKYGEEVHYSSNSTEDCYGKHAEKLRRREMKEEADEEAKNTEKTKETKVNVTKKPNAEMWSIKITESVLAMVHGDYQTIREFYIPEHDITFNVVNDQVNVFSVKEATRSRSARYYGNPDAEKMGDVYFEPKFVKFLVDYVTLKEKLHNEVIKAISTPDLRKSI